MGTIRNGANGGFSGKAGSIVGSSWNSVNYIKGLPKLSKKPASEKQLDQRARFAAALAFLGPIKDLLMVGWRGQTSGRATGFNMGVQHALSFAIVGAYPDYEVDKSQILISRGGLQKYSSEAISWIQDQGLRLEIAWDPQLNKYTGLEDDLLNVLLYNEEQDYFSIFDDVAMRSAKNASLQLPNNFLGQTVHAYMFYVSKDGSRQSNSVYVGPVTIA